MYKVSPQGFACRPLISVAVLYSLPPPSTVGRREDEIVRGLGKGR